MRSTPMAIWAANLQDEDFKRACKSDVELTHPNQTSNDVVYIYNLAIKTLIEFSDNPNKANIAYHRCVIETNKCKPQDNPYGTQDLQEWLKEVNTLFDESYIKRSYKPLSKFESPLRAMGWLKNCFVLSFYCLRYYQIYTEDRNNYEIDFFSLAYKMAISVGGDTDTNACVVCGLIGALVGFHEIPREMMGKVLSFDCTKEIINRERFLSTKYHSASLVN